MRVIATTLKKSGDIEKGTKVHLYEHLGNYYEEEVSQSCYCGHKKKQKLSGKRAKQAERALDELRRSRKGQV